MTGHTNATIPLHHFILLKQSPRIHNQYYGNTMVRRFKAPVQSVSVNERNHGYRDKCPRGHLSPVVLPRLPETFLCTDSVISPILRRTEPDPGSKLQGHLLMRRPVRLLQNRVRTCSTRPVQKRIFHLISIAALLLTLRHRYVSRLSKRESRRQPLHIPIKPHKRSVTRTLAFISQAWPRRFRSKIVPWVSRSSTARSSRSQWNWLCRSSLRSFFHTSNVVGILEDSCAGFPRIPLSLCAAGVSHVIY